MLTVNTTEAAADALLAEVARRAGPLAELGAPLIGFAETILTDLGRDPAVVRLDGPDALRTVELPDGLYEVTRWRNGREVSRVLG